MTDEQMVPWILPHAAIGLFCLPHSQNSDGLAMCPHDTLQPFLLSLLCPCRNTDKLLFREESHGPDSSLSGHTFRD